MTIKTLNTAVKHERNLMQEIEAIDKMCEEVFSIEETAEAMIDTLRKVNPETKEVVAFGDIVMVEVKAEIREINIMGFNFEDLFTSLVAAVL